MTTIAYPLGVTFGSAKTGLAASLLAACVDAGGTTRSLGSLTWAEETDAAASASTGVYSATANLDTSWQYPLKIKYTITGQSGVAARATITAAELSAFDTAGNLNVNVLKINGTSQTARDLGASVLLSSGTGTGQVSLASGRVDVGKWLGQAVTLDVNNLPNVNVKALAEDLAKPIYLGTMASNYNDGVFTVNTVNDSRMAFLSTIGTTADVGGDPTLYGQIVGANNSVNFVIDDIETGIVAPALSAIKAKTDNLPASPAAVGSAMTLTTGERTTLWAGFWAYLSIAATTVGSLGKRLVDFLTGDVYGRIGAPAGASVSADIAAVKAAGGIGAGGSDPLLNAVPGAYNAGTAGYALGHIPSVFVAAPVVGSIVGQIAGQSYPDVLYVKRHDTLPALSYALYDAQGDPVTLPSGSAAVCSIKNDLEVVIVNRAASVVTDGTSGSIPATLSYLWQTGDTSVSGNLYAEFEVTYPGGGVETYPDTGYLKVVVIDDIA